MLSSPGFMALLLGQLEPFLARCQRRMNTKCYIIKDTSVQINSIHFHFLLDIPSLLKSFKKEILADYRGDLKHRLKKTILEDFSPKICGILDSCWNIYHGLFHSHHIYFIIWKLFGRGTVYLGGLCPNKGLPKAFVHPHKQHHW